MSNLQNTAIAENKIEMEQEPKCMHNGGVGFVSSGCYRCDSGEGDHEDTSGASDPVGEVDDMR